MKKNLAALLFVSSTSSVANASDINWAMKTAYSLESDVKSHEGMIRADFAQKDDKFVVG